MDNSLPIVWPGWETVQKLGQGSYGAVYEVRRSFYGVEEKAAVKVISIPKDTGEIDEMRSEGYDDASISTTYRDYLQNLVKEYDLIRKLKGNTNIVDSDDFTVEPHADGIGYTVKIKMELLTPLVKLQSFDNPENIAVRMGRDICNALVLCEQNDIIHRDIKPQNIFISDRGDYKLGDFGVARTMEQTMAGTKIGTPDYVAPEVTLSGRYNKNADLYSLGITLYWVLNEKRTPFLPLPPTMPMLADKERARARRFGGEPIPAPKDGNGELVRIVLKACAFDPRQRYQTAAEMKADLDALVHGGYAGVQTAGFGGGYRPVSNETAYEQGTSLLTEENTGSRAAAQMTGTGWGYPSGNHGYNTAAAADPYAQETGLLTDERTGSRTTAPTTGNGGAYSMASNGNVYEQGTSLLTEENTGSRATAQMTGTGWGYPQDRQGYSPAAPAEPYAQATGLLSGEDTVAKPAEEYGTGIIGMDEVYGFGGGTGRNKAATQTPEPQPVKANTPVKAEVKARVQDFGAPMQSIDTPVKKGCKKTGLILGIFAAVLVAVVAVVLAAFNGRGTPAPVVTAKPAAANNSETAGQASPGGATDDEADSFYLELMLSNSFSPGDCRYEASERFARMVNEGTEGHITVTYYGQNELACDGESVNNAVNGANWIGLEEPELFAEYVGDCAVLSGPMLCSSNEEYNYIMASGPVQDIIERLKVENIHILDTHYSHGFYSVVTSNLEVRTPDDLKGQHIRTSNYALDTKTLECMGATVTPLAFTECLAAVSEGVCDGFYCIITRLDYDDIPIELCKHVGLTNHRIVTCWLFMAEDVYQSIPERWRSVIDEAALECGMWEQATYEDE